MSKLYISHQERINMDFVEEFDANNKVEAMRIGDLRESYHKQGRSTAVLFLVKAKI